MNRKKTGFASCLLICIVLMSGCSPAASVVMGEPTASPELVKPTTEPTIIPTPTERVILVASQEVPLEMEPPRHVLYPGEISGREQTIHDQVTESVAAEKRAYGGDEYYDGRFERPFDREMGYLGHLDIVKSTMVRTDPEFVFVSIQVVNPIVSAINTPSYYGLELDLNKDGRSLFMIRGLGPLSEEWTTEGVDVWKSSAAERRVNVASEGMIPVTGSLGFDINLLRAGRGEDNDLAWIRLRPGTADVVEIAFKHSIVGGEEGEFIWRPFTDGAPYTEKQYDLQVYYTLEQAGSPYKGEKDYPIKEVYAVDNTCRVASGYEATGYEPGLCPLSLPDVPQHRDEPPPCFTPNGAPC